MALRIRNGNAARRGFTLVELMIVMTVITIIISLAIPMYQKSIVRAKESLFARAVQHEYDHLDGTLFIDRLSPSNLASIREALDDLVREGYLRQVPLDPITGSNQSWRVVMEDSVASVSQSEPGIFDVHSGATQTSLEGTAYSDW